MKISVIEGKQPSLMDNKIGGTPYFPIGTEYPIDSGGNPMVLLLQVNLKDIDLPDYPKEGILEIFIQEETNWPIEYKIFVFQENLPITYNLPKVNTSWAIASQPLAITLEKEVCHMPISDYRADDIAISLMATLYNKQVNCLWDIDNKIIESLCKEINNPSATIGGYADFTQEDPRIESDNRDECLFKLDSMLHPSLYIGDSGILTVTISKENIITGKFEEADVDWDCC
jgi:uncharacterized protein YwqG